MGVLLAELGKHIADRWLSLLVLPGALFLAVLGAAREVGHRRWYDIGVLPSRVDEFASAVAASPAHLAILLLVFLLAAAACGLAAQALGSMWERLWLASDWYGWPAPVRRLAEWRVAGRQARYAERREALGRARAQAHVAPATVGSGLEIARHRLRRVSGVFPSRPTWMGDRLFSVESRLRADLGLDVTVLWPHLWLHVPDTTRAEIATAREAMTRAAGLAGWGLLYVLVGSVWWLGLLIPVVVIAAARRRARVATHVYATLVEAAVRVHTIDLASHVGMEPPGPLTRETGSALTAYFADGQSPPPPDPRSSSA